MTFIYEYGLFLAKVVTLVLGISAPLLLIMVAAAKQKKRKGSLEVTDLSAEHERTSQQLHQAILKGDSLKQYQKQLKQEAKLRQQEAGERPRLFVVDFKGGLDAGEVANLREEVSAILGMASQTDTVLVRLESGGGVVHGYGLGASQLQRLREHGLNLTVAIDKVAASGGYMMAAVGQHVLAAPFAIVGSIGVVAQLPNFHRLLKKHDIDYELHTAGQYKRTLTLFGENDDLGREKFQAELESIHQQFKQHIARCRPQLDLSRVATGEHWLASDALSLGLVDELRTSDDYLLEQFSQRQVIRVRYRQRKGLAERLSRSVSAGLELAIMRVWQRLQIPW